MLEHVLLADAGPALLVLAVRGPIALLAARPARAPAAGRACCCGRGVTLAAWVAVIGVWHVPALYDRALGVARPCTTSSTLSFVLVGTAGLDRR